MSGCPLRRPGDCHFYQAMRGYSSHQEKPSFHHLAHPSHHQILLYHQRYSYYPSIAFVLKLKLPQKCVLISPSPCLTLEVSQKLYAQDPQKGNFLWNPHQNTPQVGFTPVLWAPTTSWVYIYRRLSFQDCLAFSARIQIHHFLQVGRVARSWHCNRET